MEFEWDERKRAQVLADRDLDFVDADLFFDGRATSQRHARKRNGGKRPPSSKGHTLVWCWRGEKIRIITMRRAHEKEVRTYRQLHGH